MIFSNTGDEFVDIRILDLPLKLHRIQHRTYLLQDAGGVELGRHEEGASDIDPLTSLHRHQVIIPRRGLRVRIRVVQDLYGSVLVKQVQ